VSFGRIRSGSGPALQYGQCARILRNDQEIGWLGTLAAGIQQPLDIPGKRKGIDKDRGHSDEAHGSAPGQNKDKNKDKDEGKENNGNANGKDKDKDKDADDVVSFLSAQIGPLSGSGTMLILLLLALGAGVYLYQQLKVHTRGLSTSSRVAVITPYAQQSKLLRSLFSDALGPKYEDVVEVNTVDAFQGREANISLAIGSMY